MVLGVNPTSYLIYSMTGLKPIGRPGIPEYVFKSIEPSHAPFREIFGDRLKIRESVRGAYAYGAVLERASAELASMYQRKLGFDADLEVGTFQTVSVEIEKEGWYRNAEIEYIRKNKDGTFSVKLVGDDEPIVTEWIWSTLPLRVLMSLMGYKRTNLDRVYIYRVKSGKKDSRRKEDLFDPKYELVYDIDPDSPFARHVRIGIPSKPSTVHWYSEIWSLTPVKDVEDLVKFYTVPLKLSKEVKLPRGIELIGTYSEWDYRINMTHVVEKTRELARVYGIASL
jgi:hypothetical protein